MEDEPVIHRSITSERRDSEFFMQSVEDVDEFDAEEYPEDKSCVLDFQPHSSLLLQNKGHTRRGDWTNVHKDEPICKHFNAEIFNGSKVKLISLSADDEPQTNKVINQKHLKIAETGKKEMYSGCFDLGERTRISTIKNK